MIAVQTQPGNQERRLHEFCALKAREATAGRSPEVPDPYRKPPGAGVSRSWSFREQEPPGAGSSRGRNVQRQELPDNQERRLHEFPASRLAQDLHAPALKAREQAPFSLSQSEDAKAMSPVPSSILDTTDARHEAICLETET